MLRLVDEESMKIWPTPELPQGLKQHCQVGVAGEVGKLPSQQTGCEVRLSTLQQQEECHQTHTADKKSVNEISGPKLNGAQSGPTLLKQPLPWNVCLPCFTKPANFQMCHESIGFRQTTDMKHHSNALKQTRWTYPVRETSTNGSKTPKRLKFVGM